MTRYLLQAGYTNLLLHTRTKPEAAAELLESAGLSAKNRVFAADLTDEHEVAAMADAITGAYGPLYGLLNIAGASTNGMVWKLPVAEFRRMLDANVVSTFLACRAFVPGMREARRGRIINISSVVAFTGVPGASHYCAAKAAVAGFTRGIAQELASRNVVATAIALGYFDSGLIGSIPEPELAKIRERIPAGRLGSTPDVGSLAAWLLSDGGAYCPGQVFHLNGGLF